MKRTASLLLALLLALTLTACGGKTDGGITAKDGYGEGGIGDVMHSYFFDFTVNSAVLQDTYGSHTPADGWKTLVVTVTITNTLAKNVKMDKEDIESGAADIEMYDTDFQLEWDGGDEAVAVPITTDPETFSENDTVSDAQLPAVYPLKNEETRNGDLVFDVPADISEFVLCMEEYFDDGSEEGEAGDLYAVLFTVEPDSSVDEPDASAAEPDSSAG